MDNKTYTLIELCFGLKITPAWVHKTITELNLQRKGRGKMRFFTQEEFNLFNNITALLRCNVSWKEIKQMDKQKILNLDQNLIGNLNQIIGKIKDSLKQKEA